MGIINSTISSNGGSGGVSGNPKVATFADLPLANSVSANTTYDVLTTTGVWGINRKTRGTYFSDGVSAWTWLGPLPQDVGLPTGGTTGQVLAKKSGTDYDYEYITPSSGSPDPLVLAGNATAPSRPTDDTIKFFGKKRGGSLPYYNSSTSGQDEIGYSLEQGWTALFPVGTSGGYRIPLDGSNSGVSLTGTATGMDTNLQAAYGLHFSLSGTAGSSYRTGTYISERIFLFNSGLWGTTGVWTGYMATPASLANLRIGVGLTTDTSITDACDNDVSVYAGIFLNYSSARGDTNWQYWARNSTAPTVLNSGLPVLANKLYRFTLRLTRDPTVHILRVDNLTDNTTSGDLTVTLAIPLASTGLRPITYAKDLASTARINAYYTKQILRCAGINNP